ncbi:Uncharacterised protein [Sphingobacterium daejeonense]|nr:Uncharacterised protein [Sphingobacterium daejeonense]
MKYIIIMVLLAGLHTDDALSQSRDELLTKNQQYTGTEPQKDNYKAVYQLDTDNPDIVKKAF